MHDFRGLTRVQVGNTRDQTDFMITGSVTKWVSLFGEREEGFVGIAVATGTLYHEPFIRAGLRELSLADVSQSWFGRAAEMVKGFSNFFRFSFMARYGRLFTGNAYTVLAPTLSWASSRSVLPITVTRTVARHDGGWNLARRSTRVFLWIKKGDSLEERFITVKIKMPYVTLENWNDLINQKDFGPTFGLQTMVDLLQIYEEWRDVL